MPAATPTKNVKGVVEVAEPLLAVMVSSKSQVSNNTLHHCQSQHLLHTIEGFYFASDGWAVMESVRLSICLSVSRLCALSCTRKAFSPAKDDWAPRAVNLLFLSHINFRPYVAPVVFLREPFWGLTELLKARFLALSHSPFGTPSVWHQAEMFISLFQPTDKNFYCL